MLQRKVKPIMPKIPDMISLCTKIDAMIKERAMTRNIGHDLVPK